MHNMGVKKITPTPRLKDVVFTSPSLRKNEASCFSLLGGSSVINQRSLVMLGMLVNQRRNTPGKLAQ